MDLCRLMSVDGVRARMLFDAGVTNISSLAASTYSDIETILHTNTAFMGKTGTDEDMSVKSKKTIFITGLPAMTESECSAVMVEEARAVMKRDLGLNDMAWNNPSTKTRVSLKTKKQSPRRSSLNKSRTRRSCSPKLSPHLKYQFNNTKPVDLTQSIHRKMISPSVQSPQEKNTSTTSKDAAEKFETLTDDDETEPKDNTGEDFFDISTAMDETFDMSSVVENIFVDETETVFEKDVDKQDAPNDKDVDNRRESETVPERGVETEKTEKDVDTRAKRVSWGDDKNGKLCEEKEITPCNSQHQSVEETPVTPPLSLGLRQPRTPKYKVCSEDLDLHWSDSDSSDSIIDDVAENPDNGEESDVFGDTISDSLLVKASEQCLVEKKVDVELSVGMLQAAEDMSHNESDFLNHHRTTQPSRVHKRKRKKRVDKNISCKEIISDDSEEETPVEDEDSITVVDVCGHVKIFESFTRDWSKQDEFSVAVAVSRVSENNDNDEQSLRVNNGVVSGVAVSWIPWTVFYISTEHQDSSSGVARDRRVSLISQMLSRPTNRISSFEARRQFNLVYQCFGSVVSGQLSDPMIMSWLLDPASPPATINKLVLDHGEGGELVSVVTSLGSSTGYGSVSCNPGVASTLSARSRAVAEVIIVTDLEKKMRDKLETAGLLDHYQSVEMRCQLVLLKMELSGKYSFLIS